MNYAFFSQLTHSEQRILLSFLQTSVPRIREFIREYAVFQRLPCWVDFSFAHLNSILQKLNTRSDASLQILFQSLLMIQKRFRSEVSQLYSNPQSQAQLSIVIGAFSELQKNCILFVQTKAKKEQLFISSHTLTSG